MKCIVQKYGGSSVADIEKIKLIADKIARTKEEGYNIAVVVSAIGKTTNQFIEMARLISPESSQKRIGHAIKYRGEDNNGFTMYCIKRTGNRSGFINRFTGRNSYK